MKSNIKGKIKGERTNTVNKKYGKESQTLRLKKRLLNKQKKKI